jgi:DNA-binding PadR family transcriptional regulator
MPLKPLVFEILLALVDEPRHGWTLVREVETRLGGDLLLPGNFYRTLRRLLVDGLIEEARVTRRGKDVDGDDPRRRYFQLTAHGERVAKAEARRLEALVSDRRVRRLLKAR